MMIAEQYDWHTPEGAEGDCNDASLAFCRFAAASNHPVQTQQIFRRVSKDVQSHVIARVYDLCIDWTARQFDPEADFPRITTQQILEEEGWVFGDNLIIKAREWLDENLPMQ